MKKINIFILTILGLLISVSCDSDRDSNPTLLEPTGFVLNVPPYASNDIDLVNATTLELTTTQPDYGFTAGVSYSIQVSIDNTWIDATEDEEASFGTLETLFSTAKMDADASEMARIIASLAGWTNEGQLPDTPMPVYVRLKAQLGVNDTPVYSNSVELSVIPYFIMLVDALPAPYYLIGSAIGDGAWTNSTEGVGKSIIPMALIDGVSYDKITGKGEFIYTGYFPAGEGFKLVGIVGSWEEQWGNETAAGIDSPVRNDGGSSDFVVPTSGWYTITLNSVNNTLEIVATTEQSASYASMEIVGDFNNWGNDGVEPFIMTKSGGDNARVWYGKVTIDTDGGCKFRTDSSWTNNWGGDDFPYGLTTGNNIAITAGTYMVIFNDLDKCYYFIEEVE